MHSFSSAEKWAPLDIEFPQRDPPARKSTRGEGGGDRKSSVRGGDRDRGNRGAANAEPNRHSSESSRNWRDDAKGRADHRFIILTMLHSMSCCELVILKMTYLWKGEAPLP